MIRAGKGIKLLYHSIGYVSGNSLLYSLRFGPCKVAHTIIVKITRVGDMDIHCTEFFGVGRLCDQCAVALFLGSIQVFCLYSLEKKSNQKLCALNISFGKSFIGKFQLS